MDHYTSIIGWAQYGGLIGALVESVKSAKISIQMTWSCTSRLPVCRAERRTYKSLIPIGVPKGGIKAPQMLSTLGSEFKVERKPVPTAPFDILRRHFDGSFIWLEAASDLNVARARLQKLQAHVPGDYFVFDQASQQIVANSKREGGNDL
jgi:hypothetical protein